MDTKTHLLQILFFDGIKSSQKPFIQQFGLRVTTFPIENFYLDLPKQLVIIRLIVNHGAKKCQRRYCNCDEFLDVHQRLSLCIDFRGEKFAPRLLSDFSLLCLLLPSILRTYLLANGSHFSSISCPNLCNICTYK